MEKALCSKGKRNFHFSHEVLIYALFGLCSFRNLLFDFKVYFFTFQSINFKIRKTKSLEK
jgi:hypothetical protein